MPSIDIHVLDGVFSKEEKADIILRVTDAFGQIAGETIKSGTSVRIHEVSSGAWGYGGEVLTTAAARNIRERG